MKSARKSPLGVVIALIVLLAAAFAQYTTSATAFAQDTLSTGAGGNTRIGYADYSLKLIFALRAGPYVAGVDVTIYDESGAKIVDAYSKGPWFLAKLPPGTYRVIARRKGGRAAAATVTITEGKQKRAFLTW